MQSIKLKLGNFLCFKLGVAVAIHHLGFRRYRSLLLLLLLLTLNKKWIN